MCAQYEYKRPTLLDGIFTHTISTYDNDEGETLTGSFHYEAANSQHGQCLKWEYEQLPSEAIQAEGHAQFSTFVGCGSKDNQGDQRMRSYAHMLLKCISGAYLKENSDFRVRHEINGEVVLLPKKAEYKRSIREIRMHYNDLDGMGTLITIIETNGDRSVIEIEHLSYEL